MTAAPWGMLAVLVIVRCCLGMQFSSLGALGPAIRATLNIDAAALGVLIGITTLPGVLLAIPSGWLNARLGDRMIALWGLALLAAGSLLSAIAPDYATALAGRLIGGAGSAFLGVVLTKMVFDRFTGRSLTIAIGFLMSAWPAGQAMGLALMPLIEAWSDWRWAMGTTAVLCALGWVVFALVLPRRDGPPPPAIYRLAPGETAPLLAGSISWAMLNVTLNIIVGYGPSYYVGQGMSLQVAGGLVSLLTVPLMVLIPIGGWLAGFTRHPLPVTAGMIAVMAALAAILPSSPAPAATMFSLGLAMGVPCAVMASMPGLVLSKATRPIGLGINNMVLQLANTGLPPLAGLAQVLSGRADAGFLTAAACMLAGLVAHLAYMALPRPAPGR